MRFDLKAPSTELFRGKALRDGTVMQSFAFDDTNHRLYTLQVTEGGQKLPGENFSHPASYRLTQGDLTITKLDQAGKQLDHMWLRNAGHGIGCGLEIEKGVVYLWTEINAVAAPPDAWGTALCRFPFAAGKVLSPTSTQVTRYGFGLGTHVTPSLDLQNGQISARYMKAGGGFRYATFDLVRFKAGDRTPLTDIAQPALKHTFQGWTVYGNYLYLLEGDSYGSPGSVAPTGDATLTVVDRTTGAVVDRELTKAGYSLSYREPEGVAIQHTAGGPRLCFGFASGGSGSRLANIYYKNVLV